MYTASSYPHNHQYIRLEQFAIRNKLGHVVPKFLRVSSPRPVKTNVQEPSIMSFSFGFSGDDIVEEDEEKANHPDQRATALANLPALATAISHDVEELVSQNPVPLEIFESTRFILDLSAIRWLVLFMPVQRTFDFETSSINKIISLLRT